MGPHNDDSDPARMVDVVVVGEYEENVDEVLKVIGNEFYAILHQGNNNVFRCASR